MNTRTARRGVASFQQGFTLIELIVTMAILAIGISFALPEMSAFLRRNEISSVTNELVAAINVARVEAIKRSAPVAMCPSTDATVANPTCSGGGVWDTGYVVFVDTNANGNRDGAEEVVRAAGRFGQDVTIQSAGSASRVRFAPNGLMMGGAVGMRFQVGNSKVPLEDDRRYICIAMAGRATAMKSQTYLNDPRFADCGP